MRFGLEDIPAGEAGTDATVKRLIGLVSMSERRPDLRLVALQILRSAKISGRDKHGIGSAIHRFVKSRIKYVNDPVSVETVQQPEITLKLGAGDCDDQAALVAALARALGVPARFVVIGADRNSFRHIFPELLVDGNWLNADTTSPRPFGSPAPALGEKKTYSLKNNGALSMPEAMQIPIRRDVAESAVRNQAWRILSQGWENGLIDQADLRNYIAAIDGGLVEFSGNTFFEPAIKAAVNDFLGYIESNGIPSRKSFTSGLGSLNGFFGDLWNGVKSVVKPAAVVGATLIGGPAAGAAVAGTLYSGGGGGAATTSPGYSGQPVTIPAGSGSVTYNPNLPYQVPGSSGISDLLSNPIVLVGAAIALILLLKK